MALDKLKNGNPATLPLDPEIASRSAPNPEEAALAADWNATVQRLVDALPQELRQPLALSTLGEMNSREIAETIGIAEGTVRTRLMRARHILKQKLSGMMDRYDQR
jgi:RNA polymerase sigma-70 factor (ECF subfamily)